MDDDIQSKALEEKLKSQLRLLELEHAVFERMVYKNKNQHRRCSYFQYLLKVRRDLRLLRTANMEEILRPCFHVMSGTGTKQKLHVLESLKLKKSPSILDRLRGALHLLSQMTEPILKAASGISVLLACSFFIGSSMTFLALLARLRVLIQQILLDAVSVFNSVTSTSLKKQSVKIAQEGVEVFREFYPKDEECFTLLDCVWKTDKYVLIETLQNCESSKPLEENVSEDVTTKDSLVQYRTSVSSLGEDLSQLPEADNGGVTVTKSSIAIAETASSKTNNVLLPEVSENPGDATTRDCSIQYQTSVCPLGEDLSPLPEADSGGVTVTESSTPTAETASSKTNNALQPEVSDKPEDATTRDCSVQYETFVSPLGEDLSPLPEADTVGVTVIESSTPIAETASSKTNSALQPEDATTRGCSIQYETSISPLGEDMSHPLPEADKDGGATVTESSTPIAEAASSKTNNGSQTEDLEKPDDESTKPPSPAKINTNTTKPSCRATKVAFLPVKRPFAAITPNPIEEPPRKKQETGEKDKKEAEEEDGFYNLLIRGTHKDSLF